MNRPSKRLTLLVLFLAAIWLAPAVSLSAAELTLEEGDQICLVGNALGERMQHQNYWETLLYQRFPDKQLAVRNLCFPGDEPDQRIRSKNFGSPDDHLTHSKASVVMFFFGYNESFAGQAGLQAFTDEMQQLVEHTQSQKYNGSGPPRIVLISPIAFENTGDPNLPDGSEHNPRLAAYTAALQAVAEKTGVGFVDLFTPTKALFESSDQRLTLNGCHLNEAGYRALAPILDEGLFGEGGSRQINETLHSIVEDKNFHWWHRYRAVNGFSIYGDRGRAGFDGTYRNRDVMERERAILDQMTANRDQRIWAVALGKKVSAEIDDSNTLPFITPKTNVGIPNDPNAKRGKLGSLDYLDSEAQQKLFKLLPGYEINLFASEEQFPELANPVALNFDSQGRMWVSTMASYPHWKPKTKLDDKLLIFTDSDGDGRADDCDVFADGLHQPTGFEIGRGGAFIAQQPDVLFAKDTDGDGKADHVERRLIGFGSADSHHGLAAFTWGPGGQLFFQEGTFKFSQIESPYGLTRMAEAGVWQYDPRTEKFGSYISMAFANPWGHVFDRWGQDFIADASPGYSYWAAPLTGHVEFPNKHPGGAQHRRVASMGGGDPKYQHKTFYSKRIRPSAGCELVSSRHFPEDIQGNFLLANVIGERAILNFSVEEAESGFAGEEQPALVSCQDGNFRPIDLQFGPDGALYIVDWHNALIGHLQHNLRDPSRDHSHGRIWRITHKQRPLLTPPQIAEASVPELLELLKEPENRTRYRARRELAERDSAEVVAALDQWTTALGEATDETTHHLLEALWAYQTQNHVQPELLQRLLQCDDHRARAAAVRVLVAWRDRVEQPLAQLQTLVNDPHPRVRLEAVAGLSHFDGDEPIEIVLEVLEHDMDDYLQYTLDETMRTLEQ
ncbi:PVC-type heme-binding CxxCH protein [Roseimaritima ulvae]|uniref:GDSL-like Lipase/Acylhydrolase n=1 Tax=Roseimaritima ulvae TaxID=980254 RepID=A0A5B9QKA5_9BACT|nr:PVC-type heme-binding CxxCH protein [Roseimaritima ulvae]QEG39498.1 GDSL-like Lipase/Acylhydrolase [Roseimaritima ulvae]